MSAQKRILIVSHICPYPSESGVQTRIDQTLQWLSEQGFETFYLLQGARDYSKDGLKKLRDHVYHLSCVRQETYFQTTKRITRKFLGKLVKKINPTWHEIYRSKPVEVVQKGLQFVELESFCWPTTLRAARKIIKKHRPHFVLSEHAFFSACLETSPSDIVRVLDTHELFSQGHSRLMEDKSLQKIAVCSEENEKRALSKADVLIAIQKNDLEILRKWFPEKKVILMPGWHGKNFSEKVKIDNCEDRILYVASSNPYNNHGLERFLEEVWPEVIAECPQIELRIVGGVRAPSPVTSKQVLFLGRVTDGQLEEEYQKATVVINPQQAGTGLKIKCVEALSNGCALVTYAAGAEGLEEGIEEKAFWLAKDQEDFVRKIIELLKDRDLRDRTRHLAKQFSKRHFSKEAVFQGFKEVLSD